MERGGGEGRVWRREEGKGEGDEGRKRRRVMERGEWEGKGWRKEERKGEGGGGRNGRERVLVARRGGRRRRRNAILRSTRSSYPS